MAYYDALIEQWKTLSGTTDENLKAINELKVAGPVKAVAILDIISYLRSNNKWLSIKANVDKNPAAAAVVDVLMDLRATTVDLSLPIVAQVMAGLVSTGLLEQLDIDAVMGMSNTQVNWVDINYPAPINYNDLKAAGVI